MKIYHTETQADYDALMVELEGKDCKWASGRKMTESKDWTDRKENTCVSISNKRATRGSIIFFKVEYPHVPITKYKAEADKKMKFTKENVYKMAERYSVDQGYLLSDLKSDIFKLDDTPEEVVVPKFVAEWIEDCKSRGLGLSDLLNYWTSSAIPTEVIDFIEYDFAKIGCGHKEQELLAKAWLDGYEVEKEPLYYIPLPGLETADGIQQVLSQRKGDKNYFACRPNDKLKQRFTKEELEQVPECYKFYAKLIEEDAND